MSYLPDFNVQGDLLGPNANAKMASRGSRAEMEKFASQLPADIVEGLRSGKLRLADTVVYSVKAVDGEKRVSMFETQDVQEVGLRNISHGKLPNQQALLLSGVYVLAATAPTANPNQTPTDEEMKATAFDSVANFPQITNGDFELKANKIQLIPPTPCRMFVTDNNHNWALGYYKLDNPRLINPQQAIEAEFSLTTTAGLAQESTIFLGLAGTMTTP